VTVNVLGLDLSITGTGVAFTSADGTALTTLVKTNEKDGDARLVQIRETILELAPGAEFALIEAPTARSASSVISGMVHGVVREALIGLGIPYGSVLPATLKKYATGKGTGDKVPMAVEAYKRAGLEFPDDNQCDAWWAWIMARDFKGEPVFDLPKLNRESLTKIKWHWKGK
jgi:Holliday junction resolvasome RuvABC endonuclease subunit